MRPALTGTPRLRMRRVLVSALAGMLLAGLLGSAASAATPDPILLVHGWRGSPATWQDTIDAFAAEGRTAVAIALPGQDNIRNAAARAPVGLPEPATPNE